MYGSTEGHSNKNKKALKLCSNFIAKNIFTKQATIQKSATKFSYLLSDKLMKQSKPFSDSAFLKDCRVEAATKLLPDNKGLFKNISVCGPSVTVST